MNNDWIYYWDGEIDDIIFLPINDIPNRGDVIIYDWDNFDTEIGVISVMSQTLALDRPLDYMRIDIEQFKQTIMKYRTYFYMKSFYVSDIVYLKSDKIVDHYLMNLFDTPHWKKYIKDIRIDKKKLEEVSNRKSRRKKRF